MAWKNEEELAYPENLSDYDKVWPNVSIVIIDIKSSTIRIIDDPDSDTRPLNLEEFYIDRTALSMIAHIDMAHPGTIRIYTGNLGVIRVGKYDGNKFALIG